MPTARPAPIGGIGPELEHAAEPLDRFAAILGLQQRQANDLKLSKAEGQFAAGPLAQARILAAQAPSSGMLNAFDSQIQPAYDAILKDPANAPIADSLQ